MIKSNNKPYTRESSRRSWSGGPRSSGVGFFCFQALEDTKQKKLTPLDRGLPLHVNRVFNSSALEKWTVVTSTRTQDIFNVHFNTNQWIWSYISLTEQICRVVKVASTWIRLKKRVFKNVHIPAGGLGGWGGGGGGGRTRPCWVWKHKRTFASKSFFIKCFSDLDATRNARTNGTEISNQFC